MALTPHGRQNMFTNWRFGAGQKTERWWDREIASRKFRSVLHTDPSFCHDLPLLFWNGKYQAFFWMKSYKMVCRTGASAAGNAVDAFWMFATACCKQVSLWPSAASSATSCSPFWSSCKCTYVAPARSRFSLLTMLQFYFEFSLTQKRSSLRWSRANSSISARFGFNA
jgi:hypothetical protein